MNPETKIKAGEAITEKATEFQIIDSDGKVHTLSMSGLYLKTLMDIGIEREKLAYLKEKATGNQVIDTMLNDSPIKAKIIALAIINSQPIPKPEKRSIFSFKRNVEPKYMSLSQLTEFLLIRLDSPKLKVLADLVIEKMDYTAFFLSTASLRGINLLEKTVTQDTGHPAQSLEE